MEHQIQIIRQTRNNFIQLLDSLTVEQLNEIPDGYKNNIAWNAAHIIAAQQSLCYSLAGAEVKVEQSFIEKYRKGTSPESFINEDEIMLLRNFLVSHISDLEKDLQSNIFANYKSYTTSYGFELKSIQDAVRFFSIHDALHYGYALALRKAVSK